MITGLTVVTTVGPASLKGWQKMLEVFSARLSDKIAFPELDRFDKRRDALLHENCTEHRKKTLLTGGALLFFILQEHYHVKNLSTVEYTAFGKPFLKDPVLHFSLSYTDHMAYCVCSDHAVGLSADTILPVNTEVVSRFFHPKEAAVVNACTGEDGALSYTRIYTRKKSYVKLRGYSFPLTASSVCVPLRSCATPVNDKNLSCSFVTIVKDRDEILSICADHLLSAPHKISDVSDQLV